MISYIIREDSVVVFVDGKQHIVSQSNHPRFAGIVDAIDREDHEYIRENINVKDAITREITGACEGRVEVTDSQVLFNGAVVTNSIGKRILKCIEQKLPFRPLMRFLDNIMENPSRTAVEELFLFLEHNDLPITDDGHLLAYKSVTENFKDRHTGTIDNSPGQVVEMPREEVDSERERTCSSGLHFCALHYLSTAYGYGGQVVILKINPRDVVSIPSDYNNSKGRCCRYEVLCKQNKPGDDILAQGPAVVETEAVKDIVNKTSTEVYNTDGSEFVPEERGSTVHFEKPVEEVPEEVVEEKPAETVTGYSVPGELQVPTVTDETHPFVGKNLALFSVSGTFYNGRRYVEAKLPIYVALEDGMSLDDAAETLIECEEAVRYRVSNFRVGAKQTLLVRRGDGPDSLNVEIQSTGKVKLNKHVSFNGVCVESTENGKTLIGLNVGSPGRLQ
tara:strand:- start:135671 stop:137011 length:1341 start_codon:yes stop_codon:yes gene_type:complete